MMPLHSSPVGLTKLTPSCVRCLFIVSFWDGWSQVTRRDSMRSSCSTQRPTADNSHAIAGAGQQQPQQFSDWKSPSPSSSSNQLQARSDPEVTVGLHPVREPPQPPAKGASNLLLTVPTPSPNSLTPPPLHSPLSRSYVTLAIPEECAADVPLLRSRFPVRRPDDTSLATGPISPVNTLDVRIEASVKRKT